MPKQTLKLLNIAGLEKLDDESTKNLAWLYAIELVKMMGYENTAKYPKVTLSMIEDVDW